MSFNGSSLLNIILKLKIPSLSHLTFKYRNNGTKISKYFTKNSMMIAINFFNNGSV